MKHLGYKDYYKYLDAKYECLKSGTHRHHREFPLLRCFASTLQQPPLVAAPLWVFLPLVLPSTVIANCLLIPWNNTESLHFNHTLIVSCQILLGSTQNEGKIMKNCHCTNTSELDCINCPKIRMCLHAWCSAMDWVYSCFVPSVSRIGSRTSLSVNRIKKLWKEFV